MKNDVFQQIATTLYAHQRWVSEGVRNNRGDSLRKFAGRMLKNWDFYQDNGQVISGFFFISRMISGWYPRMDDSTHSDDFGRKKAREIVGGNGELWAC